jgi:O-antigen/teichoic acid export membrane protein
MRDFWKPVLHSAGAGTLNRLFGVAARLVTVPILLGYLGTERYGMWMTIASITGYITLFDLGIVSALVDKLTGHFQSNRRRRASTYVAVATLILVGLATVCGCIAFIVLTQLDYTASLKLSSATLGAEAMATVVVTLLMACAQLVTAAIARAPYTMQRGYITEWYSALGSAFGLCAIYLAVDQEQGLPVLAACLMSGPLIAGICIGAHLYGTRALIVHRVTARQFAAAARVLRHSAPNFVVLQVGATLLTTLQFILLAAYRGATEVTPYALLSQALVASQIPLAVMQQPLWTRLAALNFAGDLSGIRRAFLQYLRVATLYALVAGVLIICLSNPALALVLKRDLVLDLNLRVGFAISCGLGLIAGGNLGALILALRLSRLNAMLSIAQVVLLCVAAAILTPRFGAAGMIWSVNLTYALAIPVLTRILASRLAPPPGLMSVGTASSIS